MIDRFYYYRGFEIALRTSPFTPTEQNVPQDEAPSRSRCYIRIRSLSSQNLLDAFELQRSEKEGFSDDFDAVLAGCYAAERRINLHLNLCPRESLSVELIG